MSSIRHHLRRPLSGLLPVVLWLSIGSPAAAQSRPWSVDFGHEQAATSTNGVDATWMTDRLQAMWSRPEVGGWLFAVEHQRRYGESDVAIQSLGYRRAGDWTFSADVGVTPQATFLYRIRAGGDVSYRVVGTLVASAGYHYMQFPSSDLHQVEPALTWYHAKGNIEGRVFVTHNVTRDDTSSAVLLRTSYDVTPRVRLFGAVSAGDRIFDIASLAAGPASAYAVSAGTRLGFTPRDFINLAVMRAKEDPGFTYASFTVGYARVF